jgi:hypothetical protein
MVRHTSTMKAIFYKDWQGMWTRSGVKPTKANLVLIKKTKALNGQADIFEIAKDKKRK